MAMSSTRPLSPVGVGHPPRSVWGDPLLWAALVLAVLGWVLIAATDAELPRDDDGHAGRQALALGAAGLLALGVYRCTLAQVERAGLALLLLALTLLSAAMIPSLGALVNGGYGRLGTGPFRFPVAGPATLMVLIYLAGYLARQGEALRSRGVAFLKPLAPLGLAAALLLLKPAVGAVLLLLITTLLMFASAGARPRQLGAITGLAALLLLGLAFWSPYEAVRFLSSFGLLEDPFARGFALKPAPPIPVDWGAWIGVGLGASDWTLLNLSLGRPMLTFALLGRTLGRLGMGAVLILYAVVVWRAFAIAIRARRAGNAFGSLLAQGIGLWMGLQVLVHVVINLRLQLVTDWILPLVSEGGIDLVVFYLAIALLLRVDAPGRDALAATPAPDPAPGPGGKSPSAGRPPPWDR